MEKKVYLKQFFYKKNSFISLDIIKISSISIILSNKYYYQNEFQILYFS